MKVKNLVGQKFGRLKVIRREGSTKEGRARWLCECECGRDVVVDGSKLRCGMTKSCGCYRSELQRNKHSIYVAYKGQWLTQSQLAKKLGLSASTVTQRRQRSRKREDLYREKGKRLTCRGKEIIQVEHNGKEMTLRDLSRATGIAQSTLMYRYRIGLRGAMLVHKS